MANKIIQSTQLSIEVENGMDKDGNSTYRKKSIGSIKESSDIDAVCDVVEKITAVLDANTRYFYLTALSLVPN